MGKEQMIQEGRSREAAIERLDELGRRKKKLDEEMEEVRSEIGAAVARSRSWLIMDQAVELTGYSRATLYNLMEIHKSPLPDIGGRSGYRHV